MVKKKKEKPNISSLAELREYMQGENKDFYEDPNKTSNILSTGFYSLDHLLKGGLRSGTHVELYGGYSTGKTYLALNMMKSCQENWGKPACYINLENAWDIDRAREIGVNLDPDMCVVVKPPTMEEAYDFLKEAVRANLFGVIVIDSVSAMVPDVEVDKDMEEEQVAKGARLNSKGLRIITSLLQDTIIIYINQLRTNIGVLYGDPDVTSGGRALGFYAHMRLALAKIKMDREKREIYSVDSSNFKTTDIETGHIIRIRFRKSKFGNEGKFGELVYDYDKRGVDRIEDIKAYLFNNNLLTRSGMFYQFEGHDQKIKGKQALYEFIRDNEEFVNNLVKKE